jgi:hypothetical protein
LKIVPNTIERRVEPGSILFEEKSLIVKEKLHQTTKSKVGTKSLNYGTTRHGHGADDGGYPPAIKKTCSPRSGEKKKNWTSTG